VETTLPIATVIGARVAGASHARDDTPCQDAFAWRAVDDGVILAIADGLGSAARSAEGSQAAVAAAIQPEDLGDAVAAARAAVEALDGELRSFASTLLVVHWRNGIATAAHVGDGSAVARTPDGLCVLSAPEESEYINEVTPLTDDLWSDHVRVSEPLPNVDALALFTDGCQRAAIRPGGAPSDGFFQPLFAYLAEPGADQTEIAALLAGAKMSEHSDDDKTLLLAVTPPP
jgi:hypothetical protein